ncbi:ATP-dependent Clp protease adapter protein ClpS [Babesia sp. Xinjiang]|uniref:ATP-dependent Clp protease adapter protein ClpS n=1 Tax=Babesia sp. Xinjiang TaxID=462227 RepID=UPI000A25B749|nr:ATP-dependent Clp protease adapter protein ClpS [Babesia sp. Xinjiang]ORM40278.1 ATP-dependent Clp protease adapter protein ClpS [Babesia sp. Xinjiang]
MNAEPAAAPGAAIARPVKDEKAAVDQSHLRQTIESIKQDASAESSDQAKQNRKEETIAWRVVLYNDDIHSFTYVTEALASAIPQLSREVAHTITVEAHNSGQATVLRTWQKKAEAYCTGKWL